MTTPTNGDFNTNPYFNDYDADKNFMQVLFKPGQAVQARELTQIQNILQSQIKYMGDHIFTEGTVVVGGDVKVNNDIPYIILSESLNLSSWLNTNITGSTSNAKAKIINDAEKAAEKKRKQIVREEKAAAKKIKDAAKYAK